jgi:hypothetical protein
MLPVLSKYTNTCAKILGPLNQDFIEMIGDLDRDHGVSNEQIQMYRQVHKRIYASLYF